MDVKYDFLMQMFTMSISLFLPESFFDDFNVLFFYFLDNLNPKVCHSVCRNDIVHDRSIKIDI